MDSGVKRQRCEGEASRREEVESYPTPTSYLVDSEDLKSMSHLAEISVNPSLSPEEYKEALGNPLLCNLRLKAVNASPAELESFGALLPAADAYRLSSVIKTRLQRWPDSTVEGRAEVELQITVSQEILDRVVRAVYEKELLIDTSNAESLLLVADYLQMDWLMIAVKCYAEEKLLLSTAFNPSLKICKLAAAHPCLGIFSNTIMSLIAAKPETGGIVELILLASTSQRAVFLGAAAHLLAPERRLDLLLSLSRHPDVDLTHQEAALLADLQPSLKRLPSQAWFKESDAIQAAYMMAWATAYKAQADSADNESGGESNILVWEIPLQEAKEAANLRSPGTLTSADGRCFELMTFSDEENVGLYVSAVDSVIQRGDYFNVFAVGSMDCKAVRIEQHSGPVIGEPAWITELEEEGGNTTCGGKYLPVALYMPEALI